MEIDGPYWGERDAAYFRQLCSLSAAANGVVIPPDDFELKWTLGPADGPPVNLIPPEIGLEIFAARHGVRLERIELRGP